MSIRILGNSRIRVVELGLGTTGISQVLVNHENISSGIAFSNKLDGTLSDDGVILQIINKQGVYAYLKAIFGLLETWQFDDNVKHQLKQLQEDLSKQIIFRPASKSQ